MLEIKNLNLNFSGNPILNNINLNVPPGSITHIEGKNGSGKTSLLKCITGIYPEFEGEISIQNHQVSSTTIRNYAPLISFFIDRNFSYPFLSVKDNLEIFSYYNNVSAFSPDLNKLIEDFGLSEIVDKKVSKISAGYKQKLEIVIALLNEGKYVLLDEPTVNLDKHSAEVLYNYVLKTAEKQEKAYLIVSHNDTRLTEIASQKISL